MAGNPSTEMIEKISSVLRTEPYLFFKNKTDKDGNSEIKEKYSRLPYLVKKQIQKQIKANIKAHINQSITEIFNENDEIFDKY